MPLFLALLFVSFGASAHDDGYPYANWYRSLSRPDYTSAPYGGLISCCGDQDCQPTRYRIAADGYEVPDISTWQWVAVPKEVVIVTDNPTGDAVACWYGSVLRCFVPGSGT